MLPPPTRSVPRTKRCWHSSTCDHVKQTRAWHQNECVSVCVRARACFTTRHGAMKNPSSLESQKPRMRFLTERAVAKERREYPFSGFKVKPAQTCGSSKHNENLLPISTRGIYDLFLGRCTAPWSRRWLPWACDFVCNVQQVRLLGWLVCIQQKNRRCSHSRIQVMCENWKFILCTPGILVSCCAYLGFPSGDRARGVVQENTYHIMYGIFDLYCIQQYVAVRSVCVRMYSWLSVSGLPPSAFWAFLQRRLLESTRVRAADDAGVDTATLLFCVSFVSLRGLQQRLLTNGD